MSTHHSVGIFVSRGYSSRQESSLSLSEIFIMQILMKRSPNPSNVEQSRIIRFLRIALSKREEEVTDSSSIFKSKKLEWDGYTLYLPLCDNLLLSLFRSERIRLRVFSIYSLSANIVSPATTAREFIIHGFLFVLISFLIGSLPVTAYPRRRPGVAKNLDVPRRTIRLSNSWHRLIAEISFTFVENSIYVSSIMT